MQKAIVRTVLNPGRLSTVNNAVKSNTFHLLIIFSAIRSQFYDDDTNSGSATNRKGPKRFNISSLIDEQAIIYILAQEQSLF